jgi:hypothetical protein
MQAVTYDQIGSWRGEIGPETLRHVFPGLVKHPEGLTAALTAVATRYNQQVACPLPETLAKDVICELTNRFPSADVMRVREMLAAKLPRVGAIREQTAQTGGDACGVIAWLRVIGAAIGCELWPCSSSSSSSSSSLSQPLERSASSVRRDIKERRADQVSSRRAARDAAARLPPLRPKYVPIGMNRPPEHEIRWEDEL